MLCIPAEGSNPKIEILSLDAFTWSNCGSSIPIGKLGRQYDRRAGIRHRPRSVLRVATIFFGRFPNISRDSVSDLYPKFSAGSVLLEMKNTITGSSGPVSFVFTHPYAGY